MGLKFWDKKYRYLSDVQKNVMEDHMTKQF